MEYTNRMLLKGNEAVVYGALLPEARPHLPAGRM